MESPASASCADQSDIVHSEILKDTEKSLKESVCSEVPDGVSSSSNSNDETDTKPSSDDEGDDDAKFTDALEELVQATTLSHGESGAARESSGNLDCSSHNKNSESKSNAQTQGDSETQFRLPDEDEKEYVDAKDDINPKEEDVIIDYDEMLKQRDANMTDEEKQAKRDEAQKLKETGNNRFKESNYQGAIQSYTEALQICPLAFPKDRSIMYSNRAACKYKLEAHEDAIFDSNKALELHPHYLKALVRRAELHEKVEKLEDALTDYQKIVELDPANYAARAACMRLPDQIKEKNEKMKAEMLGKLKELGNMVLRPFGLSTNNFNLQQDPNTGSYSVQFQQNAPPPQPKPQPPSEAK